jgi:hypothetical protein
MKIYRSPKQVTIAGIKVDYLEIGDSQIGLFWQAFIEAQRSLLANNNISDNDVIDMVVKTLMGKDETKKHTLAALVFMKPKAYQYTHQLLCEAFPSLEGIHKMTSEFQGELLGYLLTVISMKMAEQADKLLGKTNEVTLSTNS